MYSNEKIKNMKNKNVVLFITFTNEEYQIEEVPEIEVPIEQLVQTTTTDGIFICIKHQEAGIYNTEFPRPVEFRIYDTSTKTGPMRGHVIITMNAAAAKDRDLIMVTNNLGLISDYHYLLKRNPKVLVKLFKQIEQDYINYDSRGKLLFSQHPENVVNYFGLIFELRRLRVEE